MVVSQITGTHYRPQHIIIFIMGTPQKGTPNFGKPPCIGKPMVDHVEPTEFIPPLSAHNQ